MDPLPTAPSFDWRRCIFCQKVLKKSTTICPALSKRADAGCGYKTLSEAVEGFQAIACLPSGINVEFWDEGDGVEETCKRHNACWHNQCRAILHPTSLERKRKLASDPARDRTIDTTNESDEGEPSSTSARLTRSASGSVVTDFSSFCFFCELEGKDNLRQALTDQLHIRVLKCATILNDTMVLAKLATGHMSSREHKYHPACLLAFYYRASKVQSAPPDAELIDRLAVHVNAESIALAEVLGFMEEVRTSNADTPTVFTLSKLCELYTEQLRRHDVKVMFPVHSTRFKDRLLANFKDLTAVNHGKEVLLTFNDHLGIALKQIRENSDADAVHLMHATKLVRKELFSIKSDFNGSFGTNCQNNEVPQILLTLVSMLLEGPGNFEKADNQAALSISQLIMFNAVKRPRRTTSTDAHHHTPTVRHSHNQETPLPIYIGMMLHKATRKAKLVDKCSKLGLCISYDRVLQISTKLANNVCSQYRSEDLVCPPVLRGEVFTVAAVDNIDHNLSSATAKSSFHGTAISLMQFPTFDRMGIDRTINHNFQSASIAVSDIVLPLSFSEVPPCILPKENPVIPPMQVQPDFTCLTNRPAESEWLKRVLLCVEAKEEPVNLTWASYHAAICVVVPKPPPVIALMPLFHHSANTAAMIRHSLTVVETAVQHLNPSQIPVVTFDQPLFALAKQIQWHWPDRYGEGKFLIMMGGLHIEMAGLRLLGHWLDGSGWIQCLVQGSVATSGVAESFISASHVKRTRYAHTVTAAVLHICQQRSYAMYCNGRPEESPILSFPEWRSKREKASTQFQYWNKVLELDLLVLSFVRSLREGNFDLYIDCIQHLVPWFFSLDQTHYARWLSVHVRDMLNLKNTHPEIACEFIAGNFTVSKSNKRFSAMSIDQAHEQLNALIKGDGGAVGLTENDPALGRWIIAGPEIMRILDEFEGNMNSSSQDFKHHEQTPSHQKRCKNDIQNLLVVFEEVGNPFNETNVDELLSLDTHTLADPAVCKTIGIAEELGISQMKSFFEERLQGTTMSILDPLPRNKLPLFSFKPASNRKDSKSLKLAGLKTDCELFSRLYIACQSRSGDLDEFFSHENQSQPPSLAQRGTLRSGTKSDLLPCFAILASSSPDISQLDVDTCIMDGAVIVQMIKPGCCRTFEEYGQKMFVPYVKSALAHVNRLDVVFDIYLPDSLKSATRDKRGTGLRTRVSALTKIPKNWQEFLRVDENKTELFHFLAEVLRSLSHDKTLLVTYDDHVMCSTQLDLDQIDPCSHEEADMRVILHCLHAGKSGSRKVSLRTVDTDVVVLAVSFFTRLHLEELWIHFGTGKNVRLIPCHELANALGPNKCLALPVFHSLTGCDTTSCFSGKGKKSAWETWNVYPLVTEAFLNLHNMSEENPEIDNATLDVLERFVIVMYDRTSDCVDLNTSRKQLFTKKSRALEMLPPTSNSFLQHVRRVVYQSVFCWGQCLVRNPKVVDPCDWGWTKDGARYVPLWMTIPEVSKVSSELIHCSCKKGCQGRCKCVKANLVCTALCLCDGECVR